ncbi:hypothetical protein Brsp06_04443 [Brucella sp. NBRC 13694]
MRLRRAGVTEYGLLPSIVGSHRRNLVQEAFISFCFVAQGSNANEKRNAKQCEY